MGIPPSGDICKPGVKGDHFYQRHPAMIRGKCERSIMCTHHYRNARNQMVILRCVGANAFFQEKVIFPFEEWQWSCPAQSRVDIWSHSLTGAELVESFPAEEVAISCDLTVTECSRDVKPAGRLSPGCSKPPRKSTPALAAA